jgi:hypothetical protein
MPNFVQQLFNIPLISHTRRNHALEHATIHIASRRFPNSTFIGRSDSRGFYLYGDVGTETLRECIEEGLARLRSGEKQLAVHSNCGTNYLTTAVMVAGVSFLALMGTRKDERPVDRLLRLPMAIVAAVFAIVLAQPLGSTLQQRITTNSDPGPLEIVSVRRLSSGKPIVHRVLTRNEHAR